MPRQPPDPGSAAFPHGGFYLMRGPDSLMAIDAGEVGMRGLGGHGHNDVLSFDLWTAGAGVVVDSGTYTYSADPAARQHMRSTSAHNTVRVDGQEIARLGSDRLLWLIANDAHPRLRCWESTPERDVLEAEHDGYRRLPDPVIHRRCLTFDKLQCIWRIDDMLEGSGEHLVELFFHPNTGLGISGDDAMCLRALRGDVWLLPSAGLALRKEPGWVSRGYGHREPATVLVYSRRARLPITLTTHLVQTPAGTSLDEARSRIERSLATGH
jgi:uncharacterized heparinase superfamily protein